MDEVDGMEEEAPEYYFVFKLAEQLQNYTVKGISASDPMRCINIID